jgi:hypothetical protein
VSADPGAMTPINMSRIFLNTKDELLERQSQ